jgi:hypothetical protein
MLRGGPAAAGGMLCGMRLRDADMPDDNGGRPASGRPAAPGGTAENPAATVRFRVSRIRPALALTGAAAFGALAAVASDRVHTLVGVLLAVGLAGYGLRDLLVPVRLAAGPEGLTVATGYAGRRRLPWATVERIRVDRRARLGLRSNLLEVDAGEDLYLFSATDLGVPCEDAADRIRALRTGR